LCSWPARNWLLVLLADAGTTAGAGTEEILYETPALAITREVSALHTDAPVAANGVDPHGCGLEARFHNLPPIWRANV
jgi:hypothetical protein